MILSDQDQRLQLQLIERVLPETAFGIYQWIESEYGIPVTLRPLSVDAWEAVLILQDGDVLRSAQGQTPYAALAHLALDIEQVRRR